MMREEVIVGRRRSGGCGSDVCCIGTGSNSVMWKTRGRLGPGYAEQPCLRGRRCNTVARGPTTCWWRGAAGVWMWRVKTGLVFSSSRRKHRLAQRVRRDDDAEDADKARGPWDLGDGLAQAPCTRGPYKREEAASTRMASAWRPVMCMTE